MSEPFTADSLGSHVESLRWMVEHPRSSTQRLVEQLTYVPNGGRRWVRTLQIQIPAIAHSTTDNWRAISLGAFRRRRFPDLMAYDENGSRLTLLTRYEHGTLLAAVLLAKHLRDFPIQTALAQEATYTPMHYSYVELFATAYDKLTSVGEVDTSKEAAHLASIFQRFLSLFDPVPSNMIKRVAALRTDFEKILEITHYLCWVKATPGHVLSLQTQHTVSDESQQEGYRDKNAPSVRWYARLRGWLMREYRGFGLAPFNISIPIPSNGLAGSYYLTLEPPQKTDVTFLDWATGNTFENNDNELDSAYDSVHFHYDSDSDGDPPDHKRAIRTYLRCSSHGHKQIAAGAIFNAVFVILVAKGHFTDTVGSSAQAWLLATPTLLTAYIADQQRHYYAYATRRQRGILWLYLAISVVFLIAASFHLAHGPASEGHWDSIGKYSAWVLLVASAMVATWYTLLGYIFRAATRWSTSRALTKSRAKLVAEVRKLQAPPVIKERFLASYSSWRVYEKIVYRYCVGVTILVLIAGVVGGLAIKVWWPDPHPSQRQTSAGGPSTIHNAGNISITMWPSTYCKNCNFKLRFVPSAPVGRSK